MGNMVAEVEVTRGLNAEAPVTRGGLATAPLNVQPTGRQRGSPLSPVWSSPYGDSPATWWQIDLLLSKRAHSWSSW